MLVLMGAAAEASARGVAAVWRRLERKGRLARQLQKLEAAGWIGRRGSGPLDERICHVTRQGQDFLAGQVDPEALWARRWDGTWRMVLFDVPQSRSSLRTKLRRRLHAMRLGWLQNSVWLSPDPVSDLTRDGADQTLAVESLLVMEGRPAGKETDAELVAGAWDFARVAKLHAAYLKLLRLRPGGVREGRWEDWTAWLTTESRAWEEIVRHDPFLPSVLCPAGYAGPAVWQARKDAHAAAAQALVRLAGRE